MTTNTQWVAGFRSAVVSPYESYTLFPSRSFADQTLRQVIRLNGGGEAVRVRLSNRFGKEPLTVGAARWARHTGGSGVDPGTSAPLTFGGRESFTLEVGEEGVSDPLPGAVAAGDRFALSLHLPGDTGLATFSVVASETGFAAPGDLTAAPALEGAETLELSRYFVSGVDVLAPAGTAIAVAFGDSWLEGAGTTPGADARFPDHLNRRLTRGWVVNQGISGNRLLTDEIGEHGLARLRRDVLDVPGVTHVILNFGLNDLGTPGNLNPEAPLPLPTAGDLISGYTELARKAHEAGLRVIAHTIGPYAGTVYEGYDSEQGQAVRCEVNDWIRTADVFDAVTDVAAAVADPDHPERILPAYDSGDHLHLNDEGARVMAAAADVAQLRL
ncbi:GDSL-type esterase/lipase family protein [Streptomyces huiliensis]|uniref:GDSL-type esterase/lipase family protein n=1 Tax=Streptomyces huiliensis TaxID=2876027 RepID=UPI001CBA8546|nr:GDSL-type esterase/lipase family protein [Streptomyces huiliensis]MBZ4324169.1 SGNH/GDSL hydrolase family protein [Streptomyces huiliensis]